MVTDVQPQSLVVLQITIMLLTPSLAIKTSYNSRFDILPCVLHAGRQFVRQECITGPEPTKLEWSG